MTEPEYVVELRGSHLTVWAGEAHPGLVADPPMPGEQAACHIRDEQGQIVGVQFNLEEHAALSDDDVAACCARAFGWGTAGPWAALQNASTQFDVLLSRLRR